ncbi:hypothetical protein [Corynebacterium marquesiae]|uniref:hypothetical protein n=1 Tax=Corynebacterium marquesiae TaxID=2913503 RepID=UPI0022BA35BC|nr:hypothetical protein [Corynebacterium marquesiae]MCZ9300489.1 hypothetical protein [Corynebacterium marquesiae]
MTVKFKWSSAAFNQIRQDPTLVGLIDDKAADIAARAGRGFDWKSSVRQGQNGRRHRAIVFTDTPRAMVVNARDNTLLKALKG